MVCDALFHPLLGCTEMTGCSIAIPTIAYGFLGVETIAVTAFEARDLMSIRRPSIIIASFVLVIYLFCSIGELLNVNWRDIALPRSFISFSPNIQRRDLPLKNTGLKSDTVIVIAALRAGDEKIAGFLNGCAIFSALSAADTSLYVSSRVLYGLARRIGSNSRLSFLRGLGSVWNLTGVPVRALFFSALAFVWLPFLRLIGGNNIEHVC